MPIVKEETGNRYGMLTVLSRHEKPTTRRAYWLCVCECGTRKPVLGDHLRSGATNNCGCVRRCSKVEVAVKIRRSKAISTKAVEISRENYRGDNPFIKPHVYRTPRKLDMGPIATAALEAVYDRRWRRDNERAMQ